MEQDVREMERPRVDPEQGDVQHVGNPQERDVHGGRAFRDKRIEDGREGNSVEDEIVVEDEANVIQINQGVTDGRKEEEEREKEGQGCAKGEAKAWGWGWSRHSCPLSEKVKMWSCETICPFKDGNRSRIRQGAQGALPIPGKEGSFDKARGGIPWIFGRAHPGGGR